jgi:hypothetical protein
MASVSPYMLHGFNTTCNSLRRLCCLWPPKITPPDRNEFQVTRFRKIKVGGGGGRCLTETPISAPPSLFSRFRKGARSLVPSIRLVLILLDLVHMLILVSKIIFVSMCTPLVAIRFGTSAQLVRSGLFSCHGGGDMEEVTEEGEGARRCRTRQADRNTIAISQAAIGTVDSK